MAVGKEEVYADSFLEIGTAHPPCGATWRSPRGGQQVERAGENMAKSLYYGYQVKNRGV